MSRETSNKLSNGDNNQTNSSNNKVKKGSYPSKQQRFGAAPLASFEDLPSDDQQSPDLDENYLRDFSPDRFAIENVLDLDSNQLLRKNDTNDGTTSPALTLTPTCTSPQVYSDRKQSDTTSQNTLTLEGRGESTTPVIGASNSGSFSSLKPEHRSERGSFSSTGCPTKGSHNSLLAIPDSGDTKTPSPDSKRKSSWTDIFFPGRSRSKSTSSSPRKSPTEKKKGVFSKIFGKKSPPRELTSPNSQQMSGVDSVDTPRVSVTDTSENEPHEELIIHSPTNEPKASEQDILGILEAAHSQMDRTPVDDLSQNEVIPTPLPPLNLRKTLKRRESTIDDEVQSLPEILPSSRSKDKHLILSSTNNRNTETVVVQIESCARDERDNSSESEIGFDESKLKIKKSSKTDKSMSESEDDFEAENLLTQDSIDYDDTSISESIAANIAAFNIQQESVKSPTRKERLDITTIPIERPRSTTPINIVPLEAYIRSSSISPDPNLEKIKLSLPGEQFTASARAKSPRKSNPSIWFEFCEKGLQSPLSRRKQRNNSCFPSLDSQNPFSVTNIDAFTTSQALSPSPGNLTPVTPLEGFNDNKWPGFGDNFVNFDNLLSANGVTNDSEKFSCKCDCNLSFNTNEAIDANSQSQTNVSTPMDESNNKNSSVSTTEHEYMEDQPLVSPCHCLCHRRADFALSLWKSSSLNKQESVSSDISSASSRLIGSSSSNSKCSPTDDIVELNS